MFYFQTADIVSQVLNFGLSAPIDMQIQDVNFERAYALGQQLLQKMRLIPGVADPHLVQVLNYPALQVDVDRLRAAKLGISQRDVANNMLTSLSSSVAGGAELLPQSGEQRELHRSRCRRRSTGSIGLNDLLDTPVTPAGRAARQRRPTALPAAPVMRLGDIADDLSRNRAWNRSTTTPCSA